MIEEQEFAEAEGTIDGAEYTTREKSEFGMLDFNEVLHDGTDPEGELESLSNELQPGDLIFIRKVIGPCNPVSLLASQLDGYFSHVSMYAGKAGDGNVPSVIDYRQEGVSEWPLQDLLDVRKPNKSEKRPGLQCLVAARPKGDARDRERAVGWGRAIARNVDAQHTVKFNTEALVTAGAILVKLSARRLMSDGVKLPGGNERGAQAIADAIEQANSDIVEFREEYSEPFESPVGIETACGGFVWQCYNGAGHPLRPALLKGTRIRPESHNAAGKVFGTPGSDLSVLDAILDDAPLDDFGVRDWSERLLGEAVQHVPDFLQSLKKLKLLYPFLPWYPGMSVMKILGPGDLFLSPDLEKRMFFTRSDRTNGQNWQKKHLKAIDR